MTTHPTRLAGRIERLEAAKQMALQHRFEEALAALAALRREFPQDLGVLRLLGNVLELRAFDTLEYRKGKLVGSPDYMAARECYEQILQQDPGNCVALIDLGDHYRNLGAFDRAFSYYAQLLEMLSSGEMRGELRAELEQLVSTFTEMLREKPAEVRAQQLKLACERALQEK